MSTMKYTPTRKLLIAFVIAALACVWALSIDATNIIASAVGWLLLAVLLVLASLSLRTRWYLNDLARSRQPGGERGRCGKETCEESASPGGVGSNRPPGRERSWRANAH